MAAGLAQQWIDANRVATAAPPRRPERPTRHAIAGHAAGGRAGRRVPRPRSRECRQHMACGRLVPIERERGGLDALQIRNERTTCLAALDVALECPLPAGSSAPSTTRLSLRCNDNSTPHEARSDLRKLGCVRYARIRNRALCTCDFDVPSEIPRSSRLPDDRIPRRRAAGTRPDTPAGAGQLRAPDRCGSPRPCCGAVASAATLRRANRSVAHARLAATQHVETVIHRQPIEPGAERRFAPEAAELFRYARRKDVLQQVLGIGGRPCHPIRQIVEARGVLLIQLFECPPVPGPDSSQPAPGRRFSRLL